MATNATVKDALRLARSLLNDDLGLNWTDAILFPKVEQAHGELIAKLILNGISSQVKRSSRITILTGATDAGNNLPTDIIRIFKVKEVATGGPITDAISMTKVDVIPTILPGTSLRYWAWNGETLLLLGATTDRDIIIDYLKESTAPVEVNSLLDFNLSEIFIGPRVAALAVMKTDANMFQTATQMANDNLGLIVRAQVKGDQNLPVRRRPFSYANRRGSRFI